MSNPSPTVTLTSGATTITLPAPTPGYAIPLDKFQAVGQTAGGTYVVYDKSVRKYRATLTFELTLEQKSDLEDFVDNTLNGMVNTFTYVDHLGVSHSGVRLGSPSIELSKDERSLYVVQLEFVDLSEALN